MTLKDKIRAERERRGWSQAELAKRVGVSQPAIRKIEAGQTVRSRYLSDVLRVLGIEEPTAPRADSFNGDRRRALTEIFLEVFRRIGSSPDARADLADPVQQKVWAELFAALATAPQVPGEVPDHNQAAKSQVDAAFHFLGLKKPDQ